METAQGNVFKNAFDFLQKIGRSLMLPVAILPVAGILLGIGGALLSGADRGVITIESEALRTFFMILRSSGGPIFDNLALIFAIGTALGLTKNDGVSAIAAVIGYVVMLGTTGVVGQAWGIETKTIMGIQSINTGVFGGIIIGCAAAAMFNRFYQIQLPPYLGFFSGKRFVPIVTAFLAILIGFILSIIWPPVQGVIDSMSDWAVSGNMAVTVFIYGLVERLLIPFGLHHIWNVPFFFEIGEFATASGDVVHGELTRFFNGDPTAGNLGGGYLFKMFGLPAAAIAMWQCAKPENKTKVGGIMISAALTSFLTGITEPIEFSFLFVAPLLYAVHALLAGLAFPIMYLAGAKLGYTFSHGFIDYTLFFAMDTNPGMVFILGPIYAVVYYGVFRFCIQKFNLKTPGREAEGEASADPIGSSSPSGSGQGGLVPVAARILTALGGAANITALDACITRLRVSVNSTDQVDEATLKALGASGVLKIGNNVQAIFGTQSEILKTEIDRIIKDGGEPMATQASATQEPIAPPSQMISEQEARQHADAIRTIFGGTSNIDDQASCALTRIRLRVKDPSLIDQNRLSDYQVVPFDDKSYHVLVGLGSEQINRLI
ncbi:glucose-specific PTS transporter subunit IIBC [Pseudobacteriovorax antillogorgiicola]|uniref:PTS system glucose-specific EIICB component n=1 Tax=Pseudobacteriovorax antillogorgiicola TaxID=1513793 RepID=A0A1Y6CJT7_9BACT|nr:glucose-specific PTS transporter subunit IIBC [Pseudobacteriovorax antillogorgiicola]TCS47984.1 PTS system D-glucose-specific IIB component (Glc family) /PTS system D-glucose-specific IIC component (Glc family) [Pseudobacteriovorax antillogorgiicola]SMF58272.1 PTS system D-glucose-specific IIB component, Glc family /PTS system D-glucose-specific IIC component, Glc family [Pseudobacteriovorax antillogorgiicola]